MDLRTKILAAAFDALSEFAGDVHDALIGESRPTEEPDDDRDRTHPDAPAVAARTWRGTFASDVKVGDLIAVDGRYFKSEPGRRALRITDRREGEHSSMFGGTAQAITLLFVDLDTDRSESITVSPSAALEIAVEVPDSVPADMGGQR